MFAFVFIDRRRGRLLLARDRLGVKPLLYYRDGARIVFGSEAKAILAAPGVQARVDPLALNQYLCFNYVPAPRTIFDGIHKLLPGHVLEIDLATGTGEPRAYWQLEFNPSERRSATDRADEVEALLVDSVRRRLVSDVPVGTFLSGGLDSSLVTAIAARSGRDDLIAFTIGFEEQAWDESRYARDVAAHVDVAHRVTILQPDAWDILPELVHHYEEPFADSSAVPTYYLCRAAAEHATVFLSGDGGDEAFAGYGRYGVVQGTRWLERTPRPLRRGLSALGARLFAPQTLTHNRALRLGQPDWARYYAQAVMPLDPVNLLPLLPEVRRGHEEIGAFLADLARSASHLPPVSLMQYLDYQVYLTNDILVKVDRASMAHSIEVRGPLLDYRMVELAAKIPLEEQMRHRQGKRILRQVARRYLPETSLAYRKQGFGVPLPLWFRGAALDRIVDTLTSSRARTRGIYDMSAIETLVSWQRANGSRDFSHTLWRLMFLEEWYNQFVDQPRAALAAL